MTVRRFDITWPTEHGPMWMNQDNLLTCLTAHCQGTEFRVLDVTADGPPRQAVKGEGAKRLSASEAVFGLLAWLTTRPEPVTLGASHNAAIAAELADQFCAENGLPDPRDDWAEALRMPKHGGSPSDE